MNEMIKVLRIEPMKAPEAIKIKAGLESYQKEVGGFIEVVYPFPDSVALICNEEGKLNGLPLNRALYNEYDDPYDIIAGTFLVVGVDPDDGNFVSLTEKQTGEYQRFFRYPEAFLMAEGKVLVINISEEMG